MGPVCRGPFQQPANPYLPGALFSSLNQSVIPLITFWGGPWASSSRKCSPSGAGSNVEPRLVCVSSHGVPKRGWLSKQHDKVSPFYRVA